jgi:hypothetical protein
MNGHYNSFADLRLIFSGWGGGGGGLKVIVLFSIDILLEVIFSHNVIESESL